MTYMFRADATHLSVQPYDVLSRNPNAVVFRHPSGTLRNVSCTYDTERGVAWFDTFDEAKHWLIRRVDADIERAKKALEDLHARRRITAKIVLTLPLLQST